MNPIARVLVALCLVLGLHAPALSQSYDYDFMGVTVAGATDAGTQIPAGSIVTGTITLDFAAGDPTQAVGTPGSSRYQIQSNGGASRTPAHPNEAVFAMTAYVDGFSFQSVPPAAGDYAYGSDVGGGDLHPPGGIFIGEEFQQVARGGPSTESIFNLVSVAGGPPYDAMGLPVAFSAPPSFNNEAAFNSTSVNGSGVSSQVDFLVTSLSQVQMVAAVPEPSTYAILIAGLASLSFAALRRRPRSAPRPERGLTSSDRRG